MSSYLSTKSSVDGERMAVSPRGGSRSRVEPVPCISQQHVLNTESHKLEAEYRGLHKARWGDQRKKVGLPSLQTANTSAIKDAQRVYDRQHEDLIDFVQTNFKMKECINFVPKVETKWKPGDIVKCHCGEEPGRHTTGAMGVKEFFKYGADKFTAEVREGKREMKWDAKKHVVEFATNAMGKIEFVHEGLGGRKPSKYVRLSDETPVENVITFMQRHWKMNHPKEAHLVITVIGGAKNFKKLDGKKKDTFNRGLVNAAETTNAWIITSGCNMGVMKAVGEAVAEGQTYKWDKFGMTHSLRCIGIAPWGYVENREDRLVSSDGKGLWNATYKVNNIIEHSKPVSLNPHHTHFFLVDDGGRFQYKGVADFRARLENKLSRPVNPTDGGEAGLGIPVVLLVLEGGFDAILDVSRSIKANIPVVICEGTGRAADILAYTYTHFVTTRDEKRILKDKHRLILEDKLMSAYGKNWNTRLGKEGARQEADKYVNIVLECCRVEKLMTVFDMNKNEELDLAILSALLKGQDARHLAQLHDQLKLALTWNRSDIAEEKIFSQDISWPVGSLDDVMTLALLQNKVEFVKLLLQNGVVMKEYLNVRRLRDLYNHDTLHRTNLHSLLRHQTRCNMFTLKDVGKFIKRLMIRYHDPIYQQDHGGSNMCSLEDKERFLKQDMTNFPKPFRELFLWAVLVNRQELAKFLWERGDEAIPSAVAATHIYGALHDLAESHETDLRDAYMQNKMEFEELAVRVLDECHNTDPEKAAMLIEIKYPTWGSMNCLEMAAAATDRDFLSTVCCQNSLSQLWKHGLSSGNLMVFFAVLFPPLIFKIDYHAMGDADTKLSPWQKIRIFYQAPVTKFTANVLMYMLFLFLYSYMLLFQYRVEITPVEWVVIAWIFTFLVEEIREMFIAGSTETMKERLHNWWDFSIFNRLDLLTMVLALIGVALRFTQYLIYAKMVYSVNCVFYFLAIMRYYSASERLGPKLVMISKMMLELLFYIMILIIFILAYGIATLALAYPIRDFYPLIFKDIFYFPYWQIYGELFLSEMEGSGPECEYAKVNMTNVDMYSLVGTAAQAAVFNNPNPGCHRFNWLIPVFTVVYMLIGNLLLLNILIAIFNHVFDQIQVNSFQIWKYGMYFLVVEYDNKPVLAPPFIIFGHMYAAVRWMCRQTCCKKDGSEGAISPRQRQMVQVFEKEMVRSMVSHTQQQLRDHVQTHVIRMHERVDEMAKMLEEERLLEQQHFEAEQNRQEDERDSRPTSRCYGDTISSAGDTRPSTGASVGGPRTESDPVRPRLFRKRSSEQNMMKLMKEQLGDLEAIQEKGGREVVPVEAQITTTVGPPPPEEPLYDEMDMKHQYKPGQDLGASTYAHLPAANTTVKPAHSDSEEEDKAKSRSRRKPKKGKGKGSSRSPDRAEGFFQQVARGGVGYKQLHEEQIDDSGEGKHPSPAQIVTLGQGHLTNVNVYGDTQVQQRLDKMEERLVHMEESSQQSLYNIESLLRNLMFSRGALSSAPGGSQLAQGTAPAPQSAWGGPTPAPLLGSQSAWAAPPPPPPPPEIGSGHRRPPQPSPSYAFRDMDHLN